MATPEPVILETFDTMCDDRTEVYGCKYTISNGPEQIGVLKKHKIPPRYVHSCLSIDLNHRGLLPRLWNYHNDDMHQYIVPYCYRGDIYTAITSNNDFCLKAVLLDCLHGLCALHGQHVVHMDVKLDNMLITDDKHGVLCDYEQTMPMGDIVPGSVGTAFAMPPEGAVLRDKSVAELHAHPSWDVWGFGVAMYEGITGVDFMTVDCHEEHYKIICDPECVRKKINDVHVAGTTEEQCTFRELLSCCLAVKPTDRRSCEELIQHSYWMSIPIITRYELQRLCERPL